MSFQELHVAVITSTRIRHSAGRRYPPPFKGPPRRHPPIALMATWTSGTGPRSSFASLDPSAFKVDWAWVEGSGGWRGAKEKSGGGSEGRAQGPPVVFKVTHES